MVTGGWGQAGGGGQEGSANPLSLKGGGAISSAPVMANEARSKRTGKRGGLSSEQQDEPSRTSEVSLHSGFSEARHHCFPQSELVGSG